MSDFYRTALDMKEELVSYRRRIYCNPEVGLELPETTAFVKETLESKGLEVEEIAPSALQVLIRGKGEGKTLLLRADMDALPIEDRSGLDFSSKRPGKMHGCGHDIHTVMAMGAALLLHERKDELQGNVKIMFQPGEEIFAGAKLMLESGLLEDPPVDAAVDMHVDPMSPVGTLDYPPGPFTTSADNFTITLRGQSAHGSAPNNAKDPISAARDLHLNLQSLRAREVAPGEYLVLSICSFNAGNSHNIFPDEAVLQGTMRTYNSKVRDYMLQRIPDVVEGIARLHEVEADFDIVMSTPSIENDPQLVEEISSYLESFDLKFKSNPGALISASDDFGYIASQIPSVLMSIGCKPEGVEKNFLHNSGVTFDEDVIPVGAATFAHIAWNWLANN
ncbi:MAG: M20 family metallopeptidase [Eubacteriales bacterium]|nr:M20 family metallopeptidase [Eubacteriales bacterium]